MISIFIVFLDTVVKPRYNRGKTDPHNNTNSGRPRSN
ncbi:MAG TPA: hypothetical protein LFV92_00430 [Rickettsia endosymbiont of Ceroptres masudai]|nr:hypothetical protein [Rickettsia endosymbiont of Ceroptres masudai]